MNLVLWLVMNILLPLMPIALVGALSHLMGWRKSTLDFLADGQLYFFSAAVCAVFTFDALKQGKLDPTFYAVILFAVLTLMCFYTASMLVAHSGHYGSPPTDGASYATREARKLALASIAATLLTTAGVCYGRSALGLL